MKRPSVSEDIVPLGKFKAQASAVLRRMRKTGRPVVITQRGKAAAVLVTPEAFDDADERAEFVRAVEQGLAELDAGKGIDDEDVEKALDAEFGPLRR